MGGALRDDTKNGCVADYQVIRFILRKKKKHAIINGGKIEEWG